MKNKRVNVVKRIVAIMLIIALSPIISILRNVDTMAYAMVSEENVQNEADTEAVNDSASETKGYLKIEGEYHLTEDIEADYLNICSDAKLYLDGYTITASTVYTNGKIYFNGGKMLCDGNFSAYSSGGIYMNLPEDYLYVGGNLNFRGYQYQGACDNGTIEIAGNIYAYNMYFSGENVVRLTGDTLQMVANSMTFATLEVCNTSEEGVYAPQGVTTNKIIDDGGKLTNAKPESVLKNYTLTQDLTIDGSLVTEGNINLNGYTLTVKGDVYASAVYANNGNLSCTGNLFVTGAYITGSGNEYIYVGKDAVIDYFSSYGSVLEIGGHADVRSYSISSTVPTKSVIRFVGEEQQIFRTDSNSVGKLEIQNTCEKGVFIPDAVSISEITGEVSKLKVLEEKYVSGWSLTEDTVWEGDLGIACSDLNLNGHTLTVNGNVEVANCKINVNGGKLICNGNYTENSKYSSNGFNFTSSGDYVYIKGNANMNSDGHTMGVIEICGDINSVSFTASGDNIVRLSGNEKQEIVAGSSTKFAIIENNNTSSEGVYVPNNIHVERVIDNSGNFVIIDKEYVIGEILGEDTVIEGDLTLISGNLDLNGHSLKITGDLKHLGGDITFNGGSLEVVGNYHNAVENLEYNMITANLIINNPADHFVIHGDMIFDYSYAVHDISDGVIEVRGNIIDNDGTDFYDNSMLRINGNSEQKISGSNQLTLANVAFENTSETGVIIEKAPYITGSVVTNENITGNISIGKTTTFDSNYYKGNVYLEGYNCITSDVTIDGNLIVKTDSYNGNGIAGNVTVTGNVILEGGRLYISGQLNVLGDIIENKTTNIYTSLEAKVYVEGNVTFSVIQKSSKNFSGELEAKGNVNIRLGSETRETTGYIGNIVLSGSESQKIDVADEITVAAITVNNSSEGGVVFDDLVSKNITGTNYSYKGVEGSVLGWTLEQNETINGDLTLIGGSLDLNGHTLTITGDFKHIAGNVVLKGGTLNINGNYDMTYTDSEGVEDVSFGVIELVNKYEYITVGKDFIYNGAYNSQWIENPSRTFIIKGDMYVKQNLSVDRLQVDGNVYVQSGNLTSLTIFNIKGNLTVETGAKVDCYADDGYIGGAVYVKPDSQGVLVSYNSQLTVMGDFVWESKTVIPVVIGSNGYGTYVLKGDNINLASGFNSDTVKLYLAGEKSQLVTVDNVKVDTLHVNNNSPSGVYIIGTFECDTLSGNVDNVHYNVENGDLIGYTLYEDTILEGNINLIGGNLDLNGHILRIKGDLTQASGTILVNGGSLIVEGKYELTEYGKLEMNNANDYVLVNGSMHTNTQYSMEGYFTEGILEVKGDFDVEMLSTLYEDYILTTQNNHLIKLSGDKAQNVSADYAYIENMELCNTSEAGVHFANKTEVNNFVYTCGKYTIGELEATQYIIGYTLTEDTTIEVDTVIAFGVMDLNGYTLTIKGNLNQYVPVMDINGGKLVVEGNYIIADNEGKDSIATTSILRMNNEDDYVLVKGNFEYNFKNKNIGNLTAGTLEIKGDLIQRKCTLQGAGTHTLILSGDKAQQLIGEAGTYYSDFGINNLSISNTSAEGIALNNLRVNGKVTQIGNSSGKLYISSTTTFENDTYNGDIVCIEEYKIPTDKKLTIRGTVYTETSSGKLNVEGDLVCYNVSRNGGEITVSGTISLSDNVVSCYGITFMEESKLILNGLNDQHVGVNEAQKFGEIELVKANLRTVNFSNSIHPKLFTKNGIEVTYADEVGMAGIQLSSDITIDGGWIIRGGTLDLNGYTLTVQGDLILIGSCLDINNGKLVTEGSLDIRNANLVMDDSEDEVSVEGSFVVQGDSTQNVLSQGTLTIYEDIKIQSTTANSEEKLPSVVAGPEHTTILEREVLTSGRTYVSKIQVDEGATLYLGKLYLKKPLKDGYESDRPLESYCQELIEEVAPEYLPDTVTGVEVSSTSATKVILDLNIPEDRTDIIGFQIYRDDVLLGITEETIYTDTGLTPETTYVYSIYAVNTYADKSFYPAVISATTTKDVTAPKTLQEVYVSERTGSSIVLKYSGATDDVAVTGYNIYRDGELIGNTTENTYKDMSISAGKIYTYAITAVDAQGNESDKSSEVSTAVIMPYISSITPQSGTSITAGNVNIKVYFPMYANGNTVILECIDGEGNVTLLTGEPLVQRAYNSKNAYAEFNWNLENISANGEYTVRATLTDADGNSTVKEILLVMEQEAPLAPETFTALSELGVVNLYIASSKSSNCVGYVVYRRESSSEDYTVIAKIDNRYMSVYKDTNVETGKTYEYKIVSVGDNKRLSEEVYAQPVTVDADTSAPRILSVKTDRQIINKTTTITVETYDNKATKKLIAEYLKENEYEVLGTVEMYDEQCTYELDTTQLADGEVQIRFTVHDGAGNVSAEYIKKYTVDNWGPAKLELDNCTTLSTSASVRFKESQDEDYSYAIIEMLKDGKYVNVGRAAGVLGYTVTGLKPNSEYTFRVVPYDKYGNRGTESETITLVTTEDTVAPVIEAISPAMSARYKDKINISATVSDNAALDRVEFLYSVDGVTYETIATVSADGKKEYTADCTLSLSELPEGEIYVKTICYDKAGNRNPLTSDNTEVIATYICDRTAPQAPANVTAYGQNGYIELSYDETTDTDIDHYIVRRTVLGEESYEIVNGGVRSYNYYDTTAKYGVAYKYVVTAVDMAGNESSVSNAVIAVVQKDTQAPVITGMSPSNNSVIGNRQVIKVGVRDNTLISTIRVEYRGANDTEAVWMLITQEEVNVTHTAFETVWNLSEIEEGRYEIRAIAIDGENNQSDYYTIQVTKDSTPPDVPTITAAAGYKSVKLSMDECMAEDFDRYEIYRKSAGTEYSKIATTKDNTYTDKSINVGELYQYYVKVYDTQGNCAISEAVTAMGNEIDDIAPVAKISQNVMAMSGYEITLDGTGSTDNEAIVTYLWDMGDGSTAQGAKPTYTYEESGVYKLSLTVYDSAGNKSKTVGTVTVADKTNSGTAIVKVTDENGNALPYAHVYVNTGDDYISVGADSNGEALIATDTGTYSVAAYKEGYLPHETMMEINNYEQRVTVIALEQKDLVVGELKVRQLSLAEMVEAGVDFSNPDNYHTCTVSITLGFVEAPLPVQIEYVWNTDAQPIKVNVGERVVTLAPVGITPKDNYSSKDDNTYGGDTSPAKVPVMTYVTDSKTISWLKDMYSVDLGVINAADTQFVLKDNKATLVLPEGLSLAKTHTPQTLVNELPDIAGGESASTSWIIKGDASGTYTINADFTGTLMPFEADVTSHFTTEKEFMVQTGEGIHIIIRPESEAYVGEQYFIDYIITNESERTFYNFNLSHSTPYQSSNSRMIKLRDEDTGEVIETEYEGEIPTFVVDDTSQLGQTAVLSNGSRLEISVFAPGDTVTATTITSVVGEADPETEYYALVSAIANRLQADNLGVKVTVQPVSSHISKTITLVEEIQVSSAYGDPVDLSTGAFTDTLDLIGYGSGHNLSLEYNSLYSSIGSTTGYGFNHNYESRIVYENGMAKYYPDPHTQILFVNEDLSQGIVRGRIIDDKVVLSEYPQGIPGNYVQLGSKDKAISLVKEENGFILTAESGKQYFDNEGRLIKVEENVGGTVTLSYTDNQIVIEDLVSKNKIKVTTNDYGYITLVEDETGRKVALTYENGYLTSVTNPVGVTIKYEYDSQGRLSKEYIQDECLLENTYDDNNRVTSQRIGDETRGYHIYSYEETEKGLIAKVTDTLGNTTTTYTEDGKVVKEIDALGAENTYTYDLSGNLIGETDAGGNTITSIRDENGNIILSRDTLGNETKYEYDANGNPSKIIAPDGTYTYMSYDANGQLLSMTDVNGVETTYEYNEYGKLIKETVEGLGSTTYEYKDGLLMSVTDRLGNISTCQYDAAGNLIIATDALGNKTIREYDALGRVVSETLSTGATTTYTYDARGNQTSQTDDNGNITTYEYNDKNERVKETFADGTSTTYQYDSESNVVAIYYPDGTCEKAQADAIGNTICKTDAIGLVYKYEFDLFGNLTKETDPEGNFVSYTYYPNSKLQSVTDKEGATTTYTYDTRARLLTVKTPNGGVTGYEYDKAGNVTAISDALGNKETYTYDKYGRQTSVTDRNGNTTTYKYDVLGRCIEVTNPLGTITKTEYDALGQLTAVKVITTEGKEYTLSYAYNSLGQVTEATDELGNVTKVEYDALGNVTALIDQEGNKTAVYTYDNLGRVQSVTDSIGNVTTNTYDIAGNLIGTIKTLNAQSEVAESRQQETKYTYDLLGRITSVTDNGGNVTQATYDKAGNTSTVTDAMGGTTTYRYNKAGQLVEEINPIGSKYIHSYNQDGNLNTSTNARGQETTYTYDLLGRVTSITDQLGTVEYTYDANGNLLTVSDKQGTITRTYDKLNRITTYTDTKGNTITYGYDEIGNLTTLMYPSGEVVSYTYYDDGKLHTATGSTGTTTYNYDARGNLITTTRPNGTEETRVYNTANQLVSKTDTNSEGEKISNYTYQYDAGGNITKVTGEKTGLADLTNITMEYDQANRLIKYNGQEVKYDKDGNMTYGPLNGEMVTYQYDCRNRLIKAGDTTYTYDAENTRTSVETPEAKTEYVTDKQRELTQTLEKTVYNKTLNTTTKTTYIYGTGLISETTNYATLYHHYNHLGSTVALTNSEGVVVEEYSYGTYGELLTGDTSKTDYLYNGEYGVVTDENGLYYMRARYYNTNIKRFINQDVVKGSIDNSQSLNRYCYVQGNPLSYTDPFGLSPFAMLKAIGHTALELIGMVPGPLGVGADTFNAIWYFSDGDMKKAALSILSATPGLASYVGKGGKAIFKSAKAAKYIDNGVSLVGNASRAILGISGVKRSLKDIKKNGANGVNIATLVLSGATGGASLFKAGKAGKALVKAAGEDLGSLVKSEKFQNAVAKAKYNFRYGKSKGGMDLSWFKKSSYVNPSDISSKPITTRINLANGRTRFTPLRESGNPVSAGMQHVIDGHFNRPLSNSRSVFTISVEDLKEILQRKNVIASPISDLGGGQYKRVVDVGENIGNTALKYGGKPTSWMEIITDVKGNIITTYPVPEP